MEQPKVSIIIPVYNVEPYLYRCLDSVIGQTYQNLDIIIVDDGSTDACGLICDEYAKKDNRILVIHTGNNGAFAARNIGLDVAKGDYIGFVDADDWLDADMYKTLMALTMEYNADIAQCEMANEGSYQQIRSQRMGKDTVFKGNEMTRALFLEEITHGLINKLFRRKCFDGFRFDTEYYHLDAVFLADVRLYCNTFVRTDKALYHYNTTNSSITRGRKLPKHISSLENLFETYSLVAFQSEPEGSFFICREIPSGGRLILPSTEISPHLVINHIRFMHNIFCKHWTASKTAKAYGDSTIAKKMLWLLYRYFPIFASLLMFIYMNLNFEEMLKWRNKRCLLLFLFIMWKSI